MQNSMCAKDGLDLCYAHYQTEEICKIACAQNGLALRFVHVQTEEIRKIACEQNGMALYNCDVISLECYILAKKCLNNVYTQLSNSKQSRVRELASTHANWNVFVNGTRNMLCVDIYDHIKRFI